MKLNNSEQDVQILITLNRTENACDKSSKKKKNPIKFTSTEILMKRNYNWKVFSVGNI